MILAKGRMPNIRHIIASIMIIREVFDFSYLIIKLSGKVFYNKSWHRKIALYLIFYSIYYIINKDAPIIIIKAAIVLMSKWSSWNISPPTMVTIRVEALLIGITRETSPVDRAKI